METPVKCDDYGFDAIYVLSVAVLKEIFLPLAFDYRVYGKENVPRQGGILMASNHQSFLDPIILGCGLDRPASFMARRTLFTGNRFFGKLISRLHAFPVDREGADIEAMREMLARLKAGKVVTIFPEGTRTSDGSIRELHTGMVMFAMKAEVPILPAVIDGAFEAWPRNKKLFSLKRISVAYGQPVYPSEYEKLESKKRIYEAVTAEVAQRMRALQQLLRGERGMLPRAPQS